MDIYKKKNGFSNKGRISSEKIGAFLSVYLAIKKPIYLSFKPDWEMRSSALFSAPLKVNIDFALCTGFAHANINFADAEEKYPDAIQHIKQIIENMGSQPEALIPTFWLLSQHCRNQ